MWTNKRFVYFKDHLFVFVLEAAGNELQCSVGSFASFLCLRLPFDAFGYEDSYISLLICCGQMLIGHAIVGMYVVWPICFTEHLSILKFICHLVFHSTGLFSSIINVSSSVAEFGQSLKFYLLYWYLGHQYI